jgi:tRNA threonylcarbamoyladenosine biosynthesis protein TsaB
MIVLGFDTATSATAVALRLADGTVLQERDDPPAGAHPGHATRLLEMARALLARAELGWAQVERVAVGVGPGTFTGLRVGVATARGLAHSLGAELVGVSSPQALAEGVFAPEVAAPDHEDRVDRVLAVIDARRGEVFAAAYERVADSPPRELAAPAALAPDDLLTVVERARRVAGGQAEPGLGGQAEPGLGGQAEPRLGGWLAVGDGALRYREHVAGTGMAMAGERSSLHRVSAAAVCALGLAARPVAGALLPDYCRRPDAELALAAAGAGAAP